MCLLTARQSDPSCTAGGPELPSCVRLPITVPCLQHPDPQVPRCAGVPIHCDYFILHAVVPDRKMQQDESQLAIRSDSTLNFLRVGGAPVMNCCPCNNPAPLSHRAFAGLPDELAAVSFLPSCEAVFSERCRTALLFVSKLILKHRLDSAPHFKAPRGG